MKKILNIESVPPLDNKEFWDKVSNEESNSILIYMIINEIRMVPNNPGELRDDEAKAKLAKLKSFVELIDFKDVFTKLKEQKKEIEDETIIDPLDRSYDDGE